VKKNLIFITNTNGNVRVDRNLMWILLTEKEKGTGTVKCGSKLHSQEHLEYLMWNVCTTLSGGVYLFVTLGK
jgi:hypothetical protein